jgi:dTDP-4-dehydrorhamnose reductase
MKYLITGKNGQLAREFAGRFDELGLPFFAPDEAELDITDPVNIENMVAAHKPGVIINCAAYNLVDKAEEEPGKTFAVNADGPRHLARTAASRGCFLVHFGSDYVFDGLKENGPYVEEDPPNPLNEYGKSKYAGEQRVLEELGSSLVFRLSWVFGEGKQNFIHKVTEWAGAGEYLKIACDEFSAPTSTRTVVDVTLKALDQGLTGRFHLTNSGFCSRYEWAKEIMNDLGIRKFIRPVTMDAFHLPARRPKFSAMDNGRLSSLLNLQIPTWEEAVRSFIAKGRHCS